MLLELFIRDLALIERVALSFGPGLNAITGETGAGKSLLVGALELLLGERPRLTPAELVRSGAERALVEGRFALQPGPATQRVRAWFEENLPELVEEAAGDELILGRALLLDGRTRAHVQQRPVSLKALKALAALLFEIHGQNDHQRLLEPYEQLRLVDLFGGLTPKLEEYRERRATWRALDERLSNLERERETRRERLDLLAFQARELEELALEPGEVEALRQERELLRSAGALGGDCAAALERIADGEGAATERLQQAERVLERWSERVEALAGPVEGLSLALDQIGEAVRGLRSFADGLEDDPARLEWVEGRLAQIERLEHKYKLAGDDLRERAAALLAERADLERAEDSSALLEQQCAASLQAVEGASEKLAQARRGLEGRLATAVTKVCAELGLAKASFTIEFRPRSGTPRERFGEQGHEELEFLLAANPGEPARALRQVASGGEAARIMLALRSVLAGGESGRTLVFDEIDSGVGGRLGPQVGARLRSLARHHQVLCVTHLAAIAALADRHLGVAKEVENGRTRTAVVELSGEQREQEIAAMIAGGADQATARAEARRLLALRV